MRDLREFVARAEELGEIKVLEGADWDLEMGAIVCLAAESEEPPALLFDRIKGYKPGYRVLVPGHNSKLHALALRLPPELKGKALAKKVYNKMKEPIKPVPPVKVKDGPIMENVHTGDKVDLFEFPTPKWQAGDGGRYIGTGDNVIVRDPDDGWINVGVYRVQIHDKKAATIFNEQGRHAAVIREKYWARGQACPVVVTCGQDPFLVDAAALKAPVGMSEYDYAGWWLKKPVEVIEGPTTGLPIPAYAEIALEGEIVPPDVETRIEGPFCEWTGHFSPARPRPAFRVKCILHRNDPIILGRPPYTGKRGSIHQTHLMHACLIQSELDRYFPGIKAVCVYSRAMVISLEQKFQGHAKQVGLAALGITGVEHSKYVIVMDDDLDPFDIRQVLFALWMRAEPEEFDIIRGCWGVELDPLLSPQKREAHDDTHSGVIINACKPYHWLKDFPPLINVTPELQQKVKEKWGKQLK